MAVEPTEPPDESSSSQLKRKRSASITNLQPPPNAPVAKTAKVTGNQLSINYIARSSNEDLPLIHKEEALPNLLHLLSLYAGVLDRHESLASNLGARPLGPILIKRFERCFDAPPKVVASHHKSASAGAEDESIRITWLEVIEFARSHPLQFTLGAFSEGRRVCQFYYPQRQLRVQISEEDFLFIKSGRCQELIPPLPIWEDEEKEVSTCDVLEAKLKELTNAADMVAARTRQLSHRLKGRRAAILERRAEGGSGTPARVGAQQTTTAHPSAAGGGQSSSTLGVNGNVSGDEAAGHALSVRNELLRHFESLPQNQHQGRPQAAPPPDSEALHGFRAYEIAAAPEHRLQHASNPPSRSPNPVSPRHDQAPDTADGQSSATHRRSGSGSGTNGTVKHNFSRPLPPALESTQPYRPLCQAHMDSLPRGCRVLPPCDRCRRLRMDCVKNLTSCAGCTKKHARCHWRYVSRDELGALDHLIDSNYSSAHSPAASDGRGNGLRGQHEEDGTHESDDDDDNDEDEDDESNPLGDLEALAEQEEAEQQSAARARAAASTWNGSLPNVDVPGLNHAVRPDLDPLDVAQAHRRKSASHVRADIGDTPRLSAPPPPATAAITPSDTTALTTTESSQALRKPVRDKSLDNANDPRPEVVSQQAVGPIGSLSAGKHREHDSSTPSSDIQPLSGTHGFRAVNTSVPSTKVQH